MPVVLAISYTPSADQRSISREARLDSAKTFQTLDGLAWKIWISEIEGDARGGIYLFDNLAQAKAWGAQAEKRLSGGGGTDLTLRYFEVDEQLSAVTRAPIPTQSAAA